MAGVGRWRTVRLSDLTTEPERYSFSWPPDGAGLPASLERHGLLRPPLAREEGGRILLVAGHRRVAALRALGVSEVPVRLVAPDEGGTLWDLLLEDQRASGPLNPVEVGLYLARRGRDLGEGEEAIAAVLPRVGLPPRPGAARDPLWVSGLPERHRDAFARGHLPLQGVRVVAGAPREDALAVLDLLGSARLGVNKFAEVARGLLECAWAEGTTVAAFAAAHGLDGAADLRRAVRELRYPNLSEWETSFAGDAERAGLPHGVRVAHPPGFEGGRLTLSVSFGSLGDLEAALRAVDEAVQAGRLAPLERYLG